LTPIISLLLLLFHGLVSVALLGAITHQLVSLLAPAPAGNNRFLSRYRRTHASAYSRAVVALYVFNFVLGSVLYPEYRLDARYALEEMQMHTVASAFELKEHWSAIGLCLLPIYLRQWNSAGSNARLSTILLTTIVWFDFLVGHIINNYRGL